MNQNLNINSKELYIQYLIDIITTNGIPYTPYDDSLNIDEMMVQLCTWYNRIKRNKVMYLLEDRDDDFVLIEEDDDEEEDEEIIKKELKKYEEPQLRDIETSLETYVDSFKTIRTYRKVLKTLCEKRTRFFCDVSIKTYSDILLKHTNFILSTCLEREYPKAKIFECLDLCLTGLDLRIIAYHTPRGAFKIKDKDIEEFVIDRVSKKALDVEDLVYFKEGLERTQYRGKNIPKILKNFTNYGSGVIPLKELIGMYVTKDTGVIYLPQEGDHNEIEMDPFRFYFLSKETNKKKYWSMDCRLDDFVRSLVKNLGLYLVDLFRGIYNDIYKDNTYREKFNESCILGNDGEQLLKNLCALSRYSSVSDAVRFHVKNKFSYKESDNDMFVLRSDDTLLKNDLIEKRTIINYDLIMMLFDGLKIETAEEIFSQYE